MGWVNWMPVSSLMNARGVRNQLWMFSICFGVAYLQIYWNNVILFTEVCGLSLDLDPRIWILGDVASLKLLHCKSILFCWHHFRQRSVYLKTESLLNPKTRNIGSMNCCHTALLKKILHPVGVWPDTDPLPGHSLIWGTDLIFIV